MYVVTEADAAAIREAYETGGELIDCSSAATAFPRHHRQRYGQGAGTSDRCMDAAPKSPQAAPPDPQGPIGMTTGAHYE